MPEISHKQAKRYIQAGADGLLSDKKRQALSAHLDQCPECRQYQEEMESLQAKVRLTLRSRLSAHNYRIPHQSPAYSTKGLYRRMRRGVRMRNIQRTSYFAFELIALLAIVVVSITIGPRLFQRFVPAVISTEEAPALLPDNEQEQVTITFAAYVDPGEAAYFQSMAEEFHQQNPAVNVQVIPLSVSDGIPLEDLAKAADTLALGGNNPASVPGFISVEPLLDADTDFSPDDFWPATLDACSDGQGSLFGIPLSVSPVGIYYNPSVFDRYRIPYPQPGWTWNDFHQITEHFKANDADKPVYALVDNQVYSIMTPILDAQLQANEGKIDPDALAASLDWYLRLAGEQRLFPRQPLTQNNGTSSYELVNSIITNDQAAMWIDSPNDVLPGYSDEKGIFVPFPAGAPDDRSSPAYFTCGAISAGSKYPRQAWVWLKFLSQQAPPGGITGGALPARRSAADSSLWAGVSQEDENALRFALEHAWYPSSQSETLTAVTEAVSRALHEGTNLAAELRAAEVSVNAVQSAQVTPTASSFLVNPPQPTPAAGVQEISFMANWGPEDLSTSMAALSDEFMSTHPDIRISLPQGFSSNDGYFIRKLAAEYDCFAYPYTGWEPLSDQDLLDLTPFMEYEPSLAQDFLPDFLEPFRVEGKLFGLPADVEVKYIAYNRDLLAERGLPMPEPGWSFDGMMALAAQAADPAASKPVFGFAGSSDLLLEARGIQWYDNSVQPPIGLFNTPELAANLEWINQLYRDGVFLPMYGSTLPEERKPVNYTSYEQAIADGQVAMWITSSGQEYEESDSFEIGYAPLPLTSTGASMSYPQFPTGYYISRHSDQPEACWEWIRFLSDHPGVFGGASPRRSIFAGQGVGENPERMDVVQTSLRNYSGYDYMDKNDPLLCPYLDSLFEIELAVLQGQNIPQLLAEAQRKADEVYTCISQKNMTGLDDIRLYNQVVQPCMNAAVP